MVSVAPHAELLEITVDWITISGLDVIILRSPPRLLHPPPPPPPPIDGELGLGDFDRFRSIELSSVGDVWFLYCVALHYTASTDLGENVGPRSELFFLD